MKKVILSNNKLYFFFTVIFAFHGFCLNFDRKLRFAVLRIDMLFLFLSLRNFRRNIFDFIDFFDL